MRSTLSSPAVVRLLDRLYARVAAEDEPARQRVRALEARLGRRLSQEQRYEAYGPAPLAIKRDVGKLLYLLTVSRRPRTVVEFGASLGISTLHLASALRDCGGGSLITTELLPGKSDAARANLAEVGLDDLVELRVGDALNTLAQLDRDVDMAFLDGRNDLYLDVLGLLEPHLGSAALVVADLSADDPDLIPYLEHVRDPANGYVSVELPLAAGVEVSVRVSPAKEPPQR